MALIAEEVGDMDVSPSVSDESGTSVADGVDLMDARLMHAYQTSVEQGSFLPLLKEELKYRILSRRHSEGKEELFPACETQRVYTLTDEERKKIMERKDRNKVSATRHRQRRKQYVEELQQRYWAAKEKNDKLQSEIRKIKEEFEIEVKQEAPKTKQIPSVRKKPKKVSTVTTSSAGAKYSDCIPSTSRQKTAAETVTSTSDSQPVTPATKTATISIGSRAVTPATATMRSSIGSQTEPVPGQLKRKIPIAVGEELPATPQAHKLVKVHVRPSGPRYVVLSVPVQAVSLAAQERRKTVAATHGVKLHAVTTGSDARTTSSLTLSQSTLPRTAAASSGFASLRSATQPDFVKIVMAGGQSRGPTSAAASTRLPGPPSPIFSSSSVQTKTSARGAIPGVMVPQLPTFTFASQDSVLLQGLTFADNASDAVIGVQLQTI